MISHASYVQCDRCGDPAQVSVEGARGARAHARLEGFKHIDNKDICPRCLQSDEEVQGDGE
jgi:hypothetical protein